MSVDSTLLALGVDSGPVTKGHQELDKLTTAAGKAEKAAEDLGASSAMAAKLVLALASAVAAAAGTIALLTHKAIEGADALNDLALGTGKSYEELQTLGVIADKSGSSLDGMLRTLNIVSKGLARSGEETEKYARALDFFEVSATDVNGKLKSSEQVAYEVAKAYSEAEKTASTAAAAQIVLGGSYEKQIPALLALKDKQEELNKLREYGAVVDENLAGASDRYNDTLRDIQSVMQGVGNDLARTLLPLLQAAADWFIRSATNGGILAGVGNVLKVSFEVVAFAAKVLTGVFITLDSGVQILGKSLGALFAMLASPLDAGNIWKELKADVAAINASTNKALEDLYKNIEKTGTASKAAGNNLGDFAVKAEKPARVIRETKEHVIDYASAIAQLEVEMQKQVLAAQGLTYETSNYDKALLQVQKDLLDGKRVTNEQIEAYLAAARALDDATKSAKEYAAQKKAIEAIEKASADSLRRYNEDLAKSVEALEHEADAQEQRVLQYGLAKSAIIEMAIAQEHANLAVYQSTDADAASVEAIKARIAALERLKVATQGEEALEATKASIKQQQQAYDEMYRYIDDLTSQLWAAVTEKGGNAWKKITEVFKNTLMAAIYKLTVQPIVLNLVASISGSAAPGGGIASGLSGLFSGGGGSLFGSLGSMFSAFTDVLSTGNGVAQAFSQALATSTLGLGSLLGGIGLVATAAGALYSWIKSKSGGPKEGGFAASGATPGIGGTDNSGARWFTPNQSDADLLRSVQGLQDQYNALLRALGGSGGATFAVGFDTDPKGKAPNRAHVGVFANGGQVYDAAYGDLGRDPETLNATLALEAKRQLLAALQASEFPSYLQSIFDSLDASTASSEQIDQLLQAAAAVKQTVEVMTSLGGAVGALDPDQILSLVDAFGGLDQALAGMAFLKANFTTDAEKAAEASKTLNDAFAAMGRDVPQTHQAFLDLLNGLDLTSAEGQKTYATLTGLAPLFVQVFGTAQDAANRTAEATSQLTEAEKALAAARAQAVKAAEDFFRANFYTDAERDAEKTLAAWDAVHKAWAENAVQLAALGLDHIPTATGEFRALIESIDRTTPAGEALYQALILLAPSIIDLVPPVVELGEEAGNTADKIDEAREALLQLAYQASLTAAQLAGELFSQIMASIGEISKGSGGDFGDQLGVRIRLLGEQMAKYQGLIDSLMATDPYSPLITQYRLILQQLGGANATALRELARFTILAAQYDAERAEQLVALEEWYEQQKVLFAGMPEALAALQALFQQRWDDIVNGTATGVTGTMEELERLRANLREYIESLKLSNLSPLSPMAKLEEARRQYMAQLALAQGGDTTALANLSQYSNAYLEIARQVFGSTSAYNAIFDEILAQLTALSTTPVTGGAEPIETIAGAIPDGKLVSQTDLREATNILADLLERLVKSNKVEEQTEAITNGLAEVAAKPVDRK